MDYNDLLDAILNMTPEERKQEVFFIDDPNVLCANTIMKVHEVHKDSDGEYYLLNC